ncbi:MAG: undecaprenyl-diphosphate phosphatase [Chloroflexota bacterium]|nr:undecaprenyl-diphosphate phosphatase [Chloroflexota bacterium]
MLLDLIKAALMGVVEGITEFLPISSTGHLIVAGSLLQFYPDNQTFANAFTIFIQLGAVVAVILFYWRKLWAQVRDIGTVQAQRFWINLFLAFLPAAVLGLLLGDLVDQYLFQNWIVATSLIIGGIIFLIIESRPQTSSTEGKITDLSAMTPVQALTIGFAQTIALIPGVSRSGASIVSALLMGMSRPVATEFSFYLAIPTLGAATLYSLFRVRDSITSDNLLVLLVGTIVSGVVAWLSIAWLLRFVASNTFKAFGYYRIVAGIVIFVLIAAGVISA